MSGGGECFVRAFRYDVSFSYVGVNLYAVRVMLNALVSSDYVILFKQ